MAVPKNWRSRGMVCYRQMREVIAYREDLHVWIYYDQADDALRYEAYVLDYDGSGEPSTLAFVIDDGILSWATTLGQYLVARELRSPGPRQSLWAIPRHTNTTLIDPTRNLYLRLAPTEIKHLHKLCATEEHRLKSKKRASWTRRLRALGYDVIPAID